ncbi:MAG: hypothetical protein PUE71_02530 [Clostridia bacterium]|nr:hypothetical protein [Clostridia bacterium]
MTRWFEENGPNGDVVISSRVRLARNITEYNFSLKLDEKSAERMIGDTLEKLKGIKELNNYTEFDFKNLNECQRHAMEERHAISRFLMEQKNAAGLVSPNEDISIMLNEEDHIRIQCFTAGMNMPLVYDKASQMDDLIGSSVDYAYHPKYGYLTTCPSSVGTGMRASYMLHLPALSGMGQLAGIMNEVGRFGLSMSSVFGEGSSSPGDIYRISNQTTLGLTEKELIDNLDNIVKQIIDQERMGRQQYIKQRRVTAEDAAYRSYGVLKYARKLSLKDALVLLSELRMGMFLGLFEENENNDFSIYQMMIGIQPYSLQLERGKLSQEELEVARSEFVRENLPDLK